jgi:putative ABC transport system permease protein
MLKNYLKTAFRHLLRNRTTTVINIGGLALGTSIAILIGLWVHDELTFNQYHKNYDRISQVYKWSGQQWLPYPLAVELKQNYRTPFRDIVTTLPPFGNALAAGDNVFTLNGQYVEAGFPKMFTLDMIEGNWDGLKDPFSIILSESTARTFFGNEPALDKVIKVNDKNEVKVTGVYRDLPHHSEFHEVKYFLPWGLALINDPAMNSYGWDNHFVFVYTELLPGVTLEQAGANIVDSEMNVIRNLDYMKEEAAENTRIWLHPMSKWHLHSDFDSNGPMQFVYLVSAIGIFVVLLACINFMNLATARSEKRMREVGVRKAIGSLRHQLVGQFYCESFLVVSISFIGALLIASIFLPAFNELSAKQITMPWTSIGFWTTGVASMTIIATLAGSYPALYLSSFKPSVVLKGQASAGRAASFFRRMLVTVQFTVSIVLIIATIVVYKQIIFAKDREVGYTRSSLLMIPARAYSSKYETIRRELLNSGVVENVAAAGGQITSAWSQGGGFTWEGKTVDPPAVGTLEVTQPFGRTIGWEIIAGRDFDENIISDSSAFVINETAAKMMGFADPVGRIVHWKSKWHGNVDKDFRVIGVIRDMVMKSPYDKTMPQVFYLSDWIGTMHVRLADNVSTSEAVKKIERLCKSIAPEAPFDFNFADADYDKKFAYEERVGKLATVFSVLAILISCLGLFGMALFMTERRTKEIGIRKVVGASVFGLWKLLSTEFVVLVGLSFVIAVPIAWFSLGAWIENFVYRTDISWQVFAGAGFGSVAVTLLTVSVQLLKAAHRSPIHSLKTE